MKLGCVVRRRSSGQSDFVACGENSLDMVAVGPTASGGGAKVRLSSLSEHVGGQAATAAVACARLGWRVRYAGALGNDDAAVRVRDALAREGVDLAVIIRPQVPTRRAVVLVDERTGDRIVLESRDPALNLQPDEIPPGVFTGARVLLVDASDPGHACHVAHLARATGVRTMVDVDRDGPDLARLLREIDVVILPGSLATALGGRVELGAALARIGRETGASAVIATVRAEGALAWCRGGEVRAPAFPVPSVVDTTGAGDAFRAGFAASWLSSAGTDPDVETLVADANLVAGLSCRGVGAQSALPTRNEVPGRLWGGV
jgi:sugar/nucleoside kinase (ribokinase family)